MRQIFFDTETTGLKPSEGHRIIEIGCVEAIDRVITNNTYHVYLNPEREIEEGAVKIHGLSFDRLKDEPKFSEIVDDFLAFISGAELVAHNASFDVDFFNSELARINRPPIENHCAGIVDTLKMARERFAMGRCSLDDLCRRYNIDRSQRTLHGALLDSELLAQVYLAMTRGQETFDMGMHVQTKQLPAFSIKKAHAPIRVIKATGPELEAHRNYLDGLKKASKGIILWNEDVAADEMSSEHQ